MTPPEIAFVTGAGSGIGQAVATRLAERDARIGLFDISEDGLATTRGIIEKHGNDAVTIVGDVRDDAQVHNAIATTVERFGPLTTAVACAGIEVLGTIPEMDYDDWDRVVGVNLTGVFTPRVTRSLR